jgi:hypothetical protein
MKNLFLSLIPFLFSAAAYCSWEAPEIIEQACYAGCTPAMEKMYDTFLNTKTAPAFLPGMSSGECHHNSSSLNPETTHYIGLLFEKNKFGSFMAPQFQYFGDSNDMKDWSLDKARKEFASETWQTSGKITWHPSSATTQYLDADGNPALVYWARQNLQTKEIYFMAWIARWSIAFCTAKPNKNGFPK